MAQEEFSPFDPEESKPAGGSKGEDLPKLPAPRPPILRDEPTSGPVTLEDVNREDAKGRLDHPFATASSLYPEVNAGRIAMLTAAAVDRICARAAAGRIEAIAAGELAAHAGLPEDIDDLLAPPLPEFAQLVIYCLYAQIPHRVFYEEMGSHPTATGRRHHGEGTEKVDGVGIAKNQLHRLQLTAAGSNMHCALSSRPLNMGTRWARSCDRFGTNFPDWAKDRLDSFADSFSEHMKPMLEADREVRKRVFNGLESGEIALAGQIDGRRLLAAIPHHLLIDLIPFGTSFLPHRSQHETFKPGRDAATVDEAIASRRSVALACGQPSTEELLAFEEDAEPLKVGKLPSMYELGINRIPDVEYSWSPSRHELARTVAGEGAKADHWRLVGVEKERDFWQIVAAIERHAQVSWTGECIDRYEAQCQPGRLQVHLPDQAAGMRALLDMANAAIVAALRWAGR